MKGRLTRTAIQAQYANMKSKRKLERRTVWFGEEYEQARKLSNRIGWTLGHVIRRAVQLGLDAMKGGAR